MPQAPLLETNLPLPNRRQGKVRDVYDCTLQDGRPALLLVATDRISAFDVVMPVGIPDKGRVLTSTSVFWFEMLRRQAAAMPALATLRHHLLSTDIDEVAGLDEAQRAPLRGRVMIGRRCRVAPIECVVRGYLAGSGWKEYRENGGVCGVKLPPGLRQCERLPAPIFTPAMKEAHGHDENISFERGCEIVGEGVMRVLRDRSIALYEMAHGYALSRGIILADTKFEFGFPMDDDEASGSARNPLDENGSSSIIVVDEALTPDSSRFWPASEYEAGREQPSFDKQFVRDYLQSLVDAGRWNKEAPGPTLPDDVIEKTAAKYREAYRRLTGSDLPTEPKT